jgi:hypothetical protein
VIALGLKAPYKLAITGASFAMASVMHTDMSDLDTWRKVWAQYRPMKNDEMLNDAL